MAKSNFYELTYIVNPVLEENQTKEIISKYTALLEENGSKIEEIDEWGIREMTYEIDGKHSGYYVNVYFTAPGDIVARIERTMRIDDNILRNLVLKYDSKMIRYRERKKNGELPALFEVEETEE